MPAAILPPPLFTDLSLAYRSINLDQAPGATRLLLLLHGVGSNELNLLPVGEYLANAHTLVLSVRAPLALGSAGYGFYQVDFSTGRPVFDPAQQQASTQLLLRFISEVKARYGLAAAQVYLLGFSQGAIMAYDAALRQPNQVRGVLAFSGRLLDETRQHHAPADTLRAVQFFVSHGQHDQVLPVAYAEQAVTFLSGLHLSTHYESFVGGHELAASALAAAHRWLSQTA